MDAGTLLFHGHAESTDWEIPKNRPAFFGSSMIALYYADHSPEYVSTYALLRNITLLDLGNVKNFGKFFDTLSDKDQEIFSRVTGYGKTDLKTEECGYKKKKSSQIRFCTEGFLRKKDEKNDDYAMLVFAKMICRYGFDGYYIPPVHRRAYTSKKKEYLTEQIILCKPVGKVLLIAPLSVKSIARNFKKGSYIRKTKVTRRK